ncbi:MAG: hypothetical protein ACTS8Z_07575 [Candidatus Limnocylindrales bacterium]
MQPTITATRVPDPDAVEFIRFCYGRRRVGWPELYDEMCAVAARGLFRGLGSDDLAAYGIGFSLFDMPALAAMSAGVVAQEQARRRPVAVVITAVTDESMEFEPLEPAHVPASIEPVTRPVARPVTDVGSVIVDVPIRLASVPVGA